MILLAIGYRVKRDEQRQGCDQPFHHPNTILLLLGYAKAYFHLPYRQSEGITQGHVKEKVIDIPDYSTISRRINRLDIKIKDTNTKEFKDEYIVIAIDSINFKVIKEVNGCKINRM